MALSPTGDRNFMAVLKRVSEFAFWGRSNGAAKAPLALNNETIDALNAAGTGVVGLIKANGSDIPVIGDSAIIGTVATGAGALVSTDGVQTLTNKTLTSPTITGATVSASINADTVKATTQFDAVTGTTGATLTNVIGMVVTVVAGTYRFRVSLPGVATANSGIKAGFKYTTAALSSIESIARIFTASAVAVQHSTTSTDQASLAASTTAAIFTDIEGTMVVTTGGTIQLQAAQNAAHADTTSVYVGASMTFTRIS